MIPGDGAGGREGDGRLRNHPAQILAGGDPRGADPQACGAHRRRSQGLEAHADGSEVLQPLVRLFQGARCNVRGHRYRCRTLACRTIGRQEARAAQYHHPSPRSDSL